MPDLQPYLDILLRPEIALTVLLASMLLAFWGGRRTSDRAVQVSELEGALADARKERQQAQDAQAELVQELGSYKGKVASHFVQTSEKLHHLTLQYRSVYDHLAAGAGELCPESLEKLEGGLGIDSLAAGDRPASRDSEADGDTRPGSPSDPAAVADSAPKAAAGAAPTQPAPGAAQGRPGEG